MTNTIFNKTHSVYTTAQVRELDRLASGVAGIPAYTLMERAGQRLLDTLKQYWPKARRICVVCGAGNNGGDGYVVARLAREAGYIVYLYSLVNPQTLADTALQALQDYLRLGGKVAPFKGVLQHADVLVDAVLGTGLTRPVEGVYLAAINAINQYPAPILAADIPSGLHSDTGQAWEAAVQATVTVTFVGLKQGLLTGQARDYLGILQLDDLGVPEEIFACIQTENKTLSPQTLQKALPPRSRTAHKGRFGHSLLIGGTTGMAGAIRLAGEATLRCGSGLVSVATQVEQANWINFNRPELMVQGIEQGENLRSVLAGKAAIGIGPGLGQSAWAREILRAALAAYSPMVLDADALNLLATMQWHSDRWILTPHPAEAARLLACTTEEIEADRVGAAKRLQKQYGGVIVLKGAGTLVVSEQAVAFCTAGNPGMASGGMGDVLTGIITALLAQGLDLYHAACVGVQLHAQAADQAALEGGERGLIASDLMPIIRQLANPSGLVDEAENEQDTVVSG